MFCRCASASERRRCGADRRGNGERAGMPDHARRGGTPHHRRAAAKLGSLAKVRGGVAPMASGVAASAASHAVSSAWIRIGSRHWPRQGRIILRVDHVSG